MKNILILICLLPFCTHAQKLSDYGYDKVRIVENDKIIQAEIKPFKSPSAIHSERFYYWYSANTIHLTQGGFSGKPLNGLYNEFYLDKNLKEKGIFKKGLKDGLWKTWNEDGTLKKVVMWKKGVLVPDNSISIWKKLNIFKRKAKPNPADSLNRNH